MRIAYKSHNLQNVKSFPSMGMLEKIEGIEGFRITEIKKKSEESYRRIRNSIFFNKVVNSSLRNN